MIVCLLRIMSPIAAEADMLHRRRFFKADTSRKGKLSKQEVSGCLQQQG